MLTETSNRLTVGEESIIELDLEAVPTSKREEEVNQEEAEEISEDQLGDEEICQETGRIRIIPDESLNEPDTESMRNARNMNTHLYEDALSDILEVREDCPQTITTVRNIRTSNPEDMLTDENAEQVLRILEDVMQRKANVKQDEKTKAVSKL